MRCGESWEFLENFRTVALSFVFSNYPTGGQFGKYVKNRMTPTNSWTSQRNQPTQFIAYLHMCQQRNEKVHAVLN